MKIRWLFAAFALVLIGTQALAETLYCHNNVHRDTIDGGKICDPHGAVSLKCMGYTGREIAAKTACYAERDACFARIKAENEQIKRENDLYYKCKAAFDRDKNKKSSNTQSKWKSRLGAAQQRNQNMSDVKRRNDQAYEKAVNNEVKKTEKMNRQNAVQADKEYRAMRERERKKAADFQRQMRQLKERQAQEARKIVPKRSVIGSNPNSGGWGDYYPPGCRNKFAFDNCAVRGSGCDREPWESPAVCTSICIGLCDYHR